VTCYSHLRRRASELIAEASREGPVLVLAPVRAAADEAVFGACETALAGVRRSGFREFVSELAAAELNRRGLVPVGRFVREALAARVTAEVLQHGELAYLEPVARFPGFPRALTATFEELRLHGAEPERLSGDLATLLAAYTRELSARRFADYAARVRLAIETLSRPGDTLSNAVVIALDLAPRTQLERALLAAILGRARASAELGLGPGDAPPDSGLASLQRHLFSADEAPVREDDGTVTIFSTSGEALEGIEIARAIHAAAAEGVLFDEMAILLRSPARHQALITEALRRAGIPFYCTAATRRPDPAGRSLLALLHCAAEGLSASRFAEYLSLGQVPDEEVPATPALWERLLVDAAVVGGLARWETRLAGLREEFHRRHAAEHDEEARESLERRIESVENLTRLALPVITRLAALPERAVWGEWISALAALAEFALREATHVLELLDELEPMADIGPVSLAEVLLVLGPRLDSLPAETKHSRFGRVWIGGIEDAGGLGFRRVFVPGVNEGLFPRPPAEDPLLLDEQRRSLGMEPRADDTELFRIAAACASERLTFSFSRLDLLTGRERVPSFYAFEAWRAAGLPEIGVREFEARAHAAIRTQAGWPAPPEPVAAIDDAEFDLATLAPLAKGSAQYLKSLPGRSVHSLRARWARWHKAWKPADGLIVEEIGADTLARHRLSARAWSPSVLQQYARCPYRFALRGIHRLRQADRPAAIQRIDPATRGDIYHTVQFELLREVADAGSLPITPGNLAATLDRLDRTLEAVAQRFEADLAPAIPQLWNAEIAAIRADLRGWLQHKAAFDSDWTPEFYELSFGLKDPAGRDPRSRQEPVEFEGGFRLQGSIDLVERHASGVLRVVDHKTGRVPEPRPDLLGGGEVLQPVLYALAAERMLGEQVAFGRLFYSTIAQNYTAIDVRLNDWARQRGFQVLRNIDDAVRDGFLPAAPRKDGCRRCEYLPVCGPYEEERIGEKSQPELRRLKELRTWR
jgi:CRISPR/Cas system-associated exonuclease Cas4 (RecB family)